MNQSKNLFLGFIPALLLCIFTGFIACNQPNTAKEKAEESESNVEETPTESNEASTFNPEYINEILDRNSARGLADPDQEKKQAIVAIVKALKAKDYSKVSDLVDAFVKNYGEDKEVEFLQGTSEAIALNSVEWKGGTPGRATDWHEPRNWSTNEVPGEDAHVVILAKNTGHQAQPVINRDVQVASIAVTNKGSLVVNPTGTLVIDGEHTYSEGITIQGGKVTSKGQIILKNIDTSELVENGFEPIADSNKYISKEHGITVSVSI